MNFKNIVFFTFIGTSTLFAEPMDLKTAKSSVFTATGSKFQEAVEALKHDGDSGTLIKVASSNVESQKRISAIEALSTIASKDDAKSLVQLLRSSNTNVVLGGTEQQEDNDDLKRAIIRALATILHIPAISDLDKDHINQFIAQCNVSLDK